MYSDDGSQPVTNTEDVIDSREIIARLDYLRAMLDNESSNQTHNLTDEEEAELIALDALAGEAVNYAPDWTYGETLIRETYFVDYCREMLQDMGDLPRELPSYIAIDWDETADNLRVDYTSVEFDGVTYWVR